MMYMAMVRKQIYLGKEENARLREVAARQGVTEAEVVRRALRRLTLRALAPKADPLDRAIGTVDAGVIDGAVRHDDYIYDDPHASR